MTDWDTSSGSRRCSSPTQRSTVSGRGGPAPSMRKVAPMFSLLNGPCTVADGAEAYQRAKCRQRAARAGGSDWRWRSLSGSGPWFPRSANAGGRRGVEPARQHRHGLGHRPNAGRPRSLERASLNSRTAGTDRSCRTRSDRRHQLSWRLPVPDRRGTPIASCRPPQLSPLRCAPPSTGDCPAPHGSLPGTLQLFSARVELPDGLGRRLFLLTRKKVCVLVRAALVTDDVHTPTPSMCTSARG